MVTEVPEKLNNLVQEVTAPQTVSQSSPITINPEVGALQIHKLSKNENVGESNV